MSDFDRFLDEFDIEEEERELRKKGKKKSSKPLKTKIQESSNNDNLRQCLQEVFSESASRDQNEKNTAVNKKKKKKTKSKKNSKTKNTKKGNSRYLLEDDIDDDKRDASALIDFIQSFDESTETNADNEDNQSNDDGYSDYYDYNKYFEAQPGANGYYPFDYHGSSRGLSTCDSLTPEIDEKVSPRRLSESDLRDCNVGCVCVCVCACVCVRFSFTALSLNRARFYTCRCARSSQLS